MGAWVTRALAITIVLSATIPAAAFHWEAPLRYSDTLPRPGWFAARFEPGASNLTISVSALAWGPGLQQISLFDEHDQLIGSFYTLREDVAAYARLSGGEVHRELRVPYFVLSGGGASLGGPGVPCASWYGMSWSSTGEIGTSLGVPPVCDGRPIRGAIVSSVGATMGDLRFELRSGDPVLVSASTSEMGGVFADASRFNGTAAEVFASNGLAPATVGAGQGERAATVMRGLYGGFLASRSLVSGEPPDLAYSHGASSGECPCTWVGGDGTRGDWNFTMSGAWTAPAYLAYVDASLPPR